MKLFPLLYVYYNSLPRIDYIVAVVNCNTRRQYLYLLQCQITHIFSLLRLPILLIAYLDVKKVFDLYFMISASVNRQP
jgi:hypothetical protein